MIEGLIFNCINGLLGSENSRKSERWWRWRQRKLALWNLGSLWLLQCVITKVIDDEFVGSKGTGLVRAQDGDGSELPNGSDTGDNDLYLASC